MKPTMKKPTRPILLGAFALLAAGPTASYAQTVKECYDEVTWDCYQAMKDAKWYEKVALGAYCSALLAGCTTELV